MCRGIGILIFIIGGMGYVWQRLYQLQQRSILLREMQQSLVRLHSYVAGRTLPIYSALHQEILVCHPQLKEYYETLCEKLSSHTKDSMYETCMQAFPEEIKRQIHKEERELWAKGFCALFSTYRPGEDKEYLIYFAEFEELQRRDYTTKKEQKKVTACTAGTALIMLLLLLI